MDEDEPICLKRFGFLPAIKPIEQRAGNRPGRKKSKRHYIKECRGVYLTTREAQVTQLAAKGCTVQESANRMRLSPRTVEFYLDNVRHKLGVRTKNELLQVLHDNNFFQQLCCDS